MAENKVTLNLNSYHGFSVDQALEGAAAAGFRYVEICAVKGWTENVMPDMDKVELGRIKKKMADLKLTPIGLGGHCNLMDAQRLDDFRKNIGLAAELGCKFIISSTGEAHFGKDEKFADDVLAENIKSFLPDLKEAGLILGLEVHGEYGTGSSLRGVVEKVGSELVGVAYDTGNTMFYGGKNCDEEIKSCADIVKYVHLKDKVGGLKEWNFPAVGKGELKLGVFMDYLEGKGYKGPYSVEIEYTESFTMNPKKPGDIDIANQAAKDSFAFFKARGY
ncbi:MAG: sugar phosphate isomerase/epimerase [Treponema sp.]|jgi:sugar phosphate isomerase/epimerase|nr:sugar phosphate isomerase/epimerase [Treponema sp.]